jgi:serine/threonine protein kinase
MLRLITLAGFAFVLLLFGVFAIVLVIALVQGPKLRRRHRLASEPGGPGGLPRQGAMPVEPVQSVEAAPRACPVCAAELPGDTPQGLCPKCLMQCVLSDAEPAPPEEEPVRTTPYPTPPTAPAPADLAAHFPDLEILELLGLGGMGAVYKARQRKLDRLVALKVLPPEWGRDPAFAERFAREARALARLSHPQVVGVHDFGEAGGHYYLLMEYVDGGSLRELQADGRLQPPQALAIVGQVCDALQYAHEQGVVHRDIKPENILLDRQGRVKIADFGLAKLLRRSRSEYTLTSAGQVMGTLDYMAPEQRTCPQAVDHRADIYSLGVVFYEMLTGELPLGRFAPPSHNTAVDARIDDVIFRALEHEPDRRYQRISAVKVDIEAIVRDDNLPVEPARRQPVRSFFLSMFSLVAPRSALRRGREDDAAARRPPPALPSPRQVPSRPPEPSEHLRKLRRLLAAVAVFCGGLGLVTFAIWNNKSDWGPRGATPYEQDSQPEGLLIGDPDELRATLQLSDRQLEKVKQILAGANREYLELEQRHTSRRVSQGTHLLVTIDRFPEEVNQLEERVWAKLDSVFVDNFTKDKAKKQLPARGVLFAFGGQTTKIEIWRDDLWYYWKVTPGDRADAIEEGNGTQLPRRYQRFWQGGPTR